MRKGRRFGLGLYTKFLLSVTIPTVITAILFFGYFFHMFLRTQKENSRAVLSSLSQSLGLEFQEIMNVGNTVYMNRDIFRTVEAMNRPQLFDLLNDLEVKRLDNNYSMSMTKLMYMASGDIDDVIFFPINSQRGICYYLDKRYGVLRELEYGGYEETAWFREAVEADGKPLFFMKHSPFYRKNTGQKDVFSSVRAIKNMDTKRIVGVFKVDVSLSTLENALLSAVSHDNGIYILDRGKVMMSVGRVTDDASVLQKTGYCVIDGRLCYVTTLSLENTDWILGHVIHLTNYINYILIAVVSFLVVLVLENLAALSMFRSRAGKIVEDVGKITDALSGIENGEPCPRLELESDEDIARIGDAVEQLSVNLKSYIDKEYVWALEQKKAEFRTLQSQINPHFLYNTLNGFIALNRMGERDKLEKGIISLTKMFRYTSVQGDETTIEGACEMLRDYLNLEKLKYEDRLDYEIRVEEGIRDFILPKLLLQPIVENSIVHGMGDTDDPLRISIVCGLEGDAVRIVLSDDGVGFDPAVLASPEHTGIRNVFERARIFSPDAQCRLDARPGGGTRISFTFPGGGRC